jgi:hypothetical protein
MEEMRNTYTILLVNPEEKIPHGSLRRHERMILKLVLSK